MRSARSEDVDLVEGGVVLEVLAGAVRRGGRPASLRQIADVAGEALADAEQRYPRPA